MVKKRELGLTRFPARRVGFWGGGGGGGGGGGVEPPKTGGFGKRAQLTNTILTQEKVRIHGGNFDFEVAIFDQSF